MDERGVLHTGLGLPVGAVRLDHHRTSWSDDYEIEAESLRSAIGGSIIAIEHIGSTCVAGIKAKPIIDMMAGVISFDVIPALVPPLQVLHYQYLGDGIVEGHHVFGKGDFRTHLLHVVEHEGVRWRGLRAFRELLLRDPAFAAEYEAVKIDLAERFASDRCGYREAKRAFVDPVVAGLVDAT